MNSNTDNINSEDIGNMFDEHIKCEFVKHDVEATMNTMVKEPYVHHVPVLTGGIGYDRL
jgi:carboxymethylenebutenolidase